MAATFIIAPRFFIFLRLFMTLYALNYIVLLSDDNTLPLVFAKSVNSDLSVRFGWYDRSYHEPQRQPVSSWSSWSKHGYLCIPRKRDNRIYGHREKSSLCDREAYSHQC